MDDYREPPAQEIKEWKRAKEVAKLLGIHEKTIQRAVGRGEITERRRRGKTSPMYVNLEEVQEFFSELIDRRTANAVDGSVGTVRGGVGTIRGGVGTGSEFSQGNIKDSEVEKHLKRELAQLRKDYDDLKEQNKTLLKIAEPLPSLISQQQILSSQLQKLIEAPKTYKPYVEAEQTKKVETEGKQEKKQEKKKAKIQKKRGLWGLFR